MAIDWPNDTNSWLGAHGVIVQAFLRWAETARTSERAKAANALGRAYLKSEMSRQEKEAAVMAMTYLLDDPSPRVRLALAEALADSESAPRAVMMSLAEDQAEVAFAVISRSPVLADADLVELVGRGDGTTRVLVASRMAVSRAVSAAIAEVGGEPEVQMLLENPNAQITRFTLRRIAERHGRDCEIRNLLLERPELPAEARHLLMQFVTDALSGFEFVRATIGGRRLERVTREAGEAATVAIAGAAAHGEIPDLVEHLRVAGRLTPAFLMHALCTGKVEFFANAIINLSGCAERRVRSILATGRFHAVRALYESAGLPHDISAVFVEATMLWRQAARSDHSSTLDNIAGRLLECFRKPLTATPMAGELMQMVEKLHIAEQRQAARSYANITAVAAA